MPYCNSSRSGRVFFRYGDGPEDNVISRQPPVDYSTELIQAGGSQPVNCGIYRVKLKLEWVASNGAAQTFYMWFSDTPTPDYYREATCLQAPFAFELQRIYGYSNVFVWFLFITTPGSIYRNSAGNWIVGAGYLCTNPDFPPQTGFYSVQVTALQNTTPTATVVETEWVGGNPEVPQSSGCRFRVWDAGGQLYDRTEAECPIVRVECEDDNCECICTVIPLAHQIRERLQAL